jgi:hypothetical protein
MVSQMSEPTKNNKEVPAYDSHRKIWDSVWARVGARQSRSALRRDLPRLYEAVVPSSTPFNHFLRAWLSRWVRLSELDVLKIGGAGGLGLLLSPVSKSCTLLDFSEPAIERARAVLSTRIPQVQSLAVA